MSAQPEPIRPANEPYSRTEIDLKFEALEQRLDNKLDRVLHQIDLLSQRNDERFKAIEEKISYVVKLSWGMFIMLLGIVTLAAIKYLFLVKP